MGTVYINPQ
ncbi:TPA_asm: UL24 uORF 3 RNA *1 [Human alphaherpesvirus 1]|nr:TPA_asm: UL24 uORF 3 RNA *1 [Human alphaherpesvirus 1]